jgi:O-antigen ligase
MTVEAPPEEDPALPEEDEAGAAPRGGVTIERRAAAAALAFLPAALIVFFGFNGGGYFPGSVGFAALLVSQMIVVRVLVADDPFAGFSRPLALVAVLFAAFTGWVLASALWSDAEDRALIEFDRALLYLLVLVLMGLVLRRVDRVKWIVRGCAVAAFVVCAAGLISRVLPHVWHTTPGVANNRLSFPLTYWNALGILAAIGLLLAVGLTANDRESRVPRALAAAAVPVFACTLLFTFSRGAIAVTAVGLVAYLVLARQRALPAGLLAVVPPTLIALVVAYDADELASLHPATARGVAQGKDVALAIGLAMLAAGVLRIALTILDRRMERVRLSRGVRKRLRLGSAAFATVVVAVALAAGGASWISDQYHGFIKGADLSTNTDLRTRLTDPSSNGRTDHWRAAFDGFDEQPLRGTGAGTYQFTWEQHRRVPITVVDAHGLYFETLSELGIVGLVLLLLVVVAVLVTFARRASGLNRGYYAALFGAGIAWALHAGVDWDWEMPAVTLWFFACGGAALASRGKKNAAVAPTTLTNGSRISIAAAFLILAATPALLMLSQAKVSDAATSFNHGDCRGATASALKSLDYMAIRPEPYEMLGYCDLDQGRLTQGVAAMRKVVQYAPRSWEAHYSLAIAQAEAGSDPRPEFADARRLNPREQLLSQAAPSFRASSPAGWVKAGATARREILGSGRLTLK